MRSGMNDNCTWTADPEAGTPPSQAHLLADVRIAEELAIRYADSRSNSKSAHGQNRSSCEASLFGSIEQSHSVTAADIANARHLLSRGAFDPPVHIPLAAFYIAGALLAADRIRRRFPADEKAPAILATIFASVALAIVILVLGHLWDGIVEMIRVGNTHMSYRVDRLGWREHSEEVFAAAVVVFWCVVLAGYKLGTQNHSSSADAPALNR